MNRFAPTAAARGLAALAAAVLHCAAWAQPNPQAQEEAKAAMEAAGKSKIAGPSEVKLGDQAVLKLPAAFLYVPPAEGGRLLKSMGNQPSEGLLGLVFPDGPGEWMVVMGFVSAGYVKDDDARDWKADKLLANLKEGTEQVNAERRTRGFPELEIVGWVEAPAYNAGTRRLVWSAETRRKGASAEAERGVNYNTYALGREGYISLNLVTGMRTIQAEKRNAHTLLAALQYNDGKRYGDFNSSTDHVAEYGLAALIGGVAAKKLGLFALMFAFLAKFAKVIGIAAVAIGAIAFKFFRRKTQSAPPPPPQA